MKKILLILATVSFMTGAWANENIVDDVPEESGMRIVAISPYAGIISGLDVHLGKVYVGIGTNFMESKDSTDPNYVVDDFKGWTYSPEINTTTNELLRLSFGVSPMEKIAVGLHVAIGTIKAKNSDLLEMYDISLDSAATFGFGLEAAYAFYDNFFIKGSVTYFFGAETFGDVSFYDKGSDFMGTLRYKEDDRLSMGSAITFGIGLGYRFNL